MKIVVLVKEVPDTWGTRKLDLETGLADRAAGDVVLDEVGERALEAALSYADQHPDAEVSVLTMGPQSAQASLRKALAMGAASGTHVVDDGLVGADLGLTAQVLAAALRRSSPDLVIAGNQSTDGGGGVIPAMVAELLELPHATNLSGIEIADGVVRGERSSDAGTMSVESPLPAVVSVNEQAADPRIAGFKGIVAAKKKPVETLSLADLGVDADAAVPRSILVSVAERPPRTAGEKITDDGSIGARVVEFLSERGAL